MFNYHHMRNAVGRLASSYVLSSPTRNVDEALENFTQKGEMPKRVNRMPTPSSSRKRLRTTKKLKSITRRDKARKLLWKVSPNNPVPGNAVAGAMKFKGGKVKKEGRKKKVRVSKAFRRKVNEAIKSRNGTGWFKERVPQQVMIPVDNEQVIKTCVGRQVDDSGAFHFTPTYVDYSASVLYNKKAQVSPYANVPIDDANMYRRENLKIEVLEQYYIVRFRNNTARTMDVTIWDVSPKYTQESGSAGVSNYGPETHWDQALVQGAPSGGLGTVGQQSNENPVAVAKTVIGAHPMDSAYFRGQYTCDTTYIKLEPGKEYYHKVKGPNRKVYEYNKFFKNGRWFNIKPFCKSTLVGMSLDLNSTGTGSLAQRTSDIVTGQGYGLVTEVQTFIKLRLPDKAGFQNPSVSGIGEIQQLTQVGNAFAIKNWYPTQDGAVNMVEDENPQNIALFGV